MIVKVLEHTRRGTAAFSARQRGSAALFIVACILPLLFLLLSLSLDLSAYFRNLQDVSQVMDDAAMYAYRFLPDEQAAVEAARRYLAGRTSFASQIEASVHEDGIVLRLNASSRLFFAELVGVRQGIPLHAATKVRGTPYDVLLLMDTSSYLAPGLRGVPWGDGSSWGAADYFTPQQHPAFEEQNPVDPVLQTQQCFNPKFNALKLAAITTYEYFSRFRMNAIGLALYPARYTVPPQALLEQPELALDASRPVSPTEAYGGPPADFVALSGDTDLLCAAAAEREPWYENYRFPGESVPSPHRVLPDGSRLNSDYIPPPAEVIWSRAAKNHNGDFGLVLNALTGALLNSRPLAMRQGLSARSQKAAVVFAGDLPWVNGQRFPSLQAQAALRSACQTLRANTERIKADLRVYYLLIADPRAPQTAGAGDAQALSAFFTDANGCGSTEASRFNVRLLYAEGFEAASRAMLGAMLLDKKTAVISK